MSREKAFKSIEKSVNNNLDTILMIIKHDQVENENYH